MEKVPIDLQKIFKVNAKAKQQWDTLTPIGRRDFISWIDSAKQAETRKRRVNSVPSRLASGKKRPCCFTLVPMSLYKALGESPKAKATWKELTADQKRDFVDWIDDSKTESKPVRIGKACAMLAAGKQQP